MTIGRGVSHNRFVVSITDSQLKFVNRQAAITGLGRAHVFRKALALLQDKVSADAKAARAAAIEAEIADNEGAC
ncbi:hypothetical protein NKI01_09005 [Mesorhizobium sp. M0815]|uniref:hypothetical protein n=1 Tax=Mesorhizobium sp. M0815 TaxID=2957005 RepID=UPI0033359242